MKRMLWCALAAVFLTACSSTTRTPVRERPAACTPDESLVGVWKSSRMSQLGPAWMRFDFRCDCTFVSRVGLVFTRIVEEGYYRVDDGTIGFIGPSGRTTWPYEIRDGKLLLSESPDEVHDYRRTEARDCGPAGSTAQAASDGR